jgi:hypothetical protein
MRTVLALVLSGALGTGRAPCAPVPPWLAHAVHVRATILDEHGNRRTCYSTVTPPSETATVCFDD